MAKKILAADDSKENRLFIELVLQKEGYEFVIVNDGKEALEKYYEFKPDIIVTDLFMPNYNGIQLFLEIRKKDKETPILAFTGADFEDEDPEIKELGFNEFIHKPINEESFLAVIKKYV